MEMQILAPEFDYSLLDQETRIVVQQRTSEIRSLISRSSELFREIGNKLLEVKTRLGHGHFGEWLSREFQWTERTAENYILIATKYETISDLSNVSPTALYLLARESTPEVVREAAIAQIESGEKVTPKQVRSAIQAAKLQAGDERLVIEPQHPLHGQTVTIQKTDGDIVYCEVEGEVKPIAAGWLGTETDLVPQSETPPTKPKEPKTQLSELYESTQFALEISRQRCEALQALIQKILEQVQLPPELVQEVEELGILMPVR